MKLRSSFITALFFSFILVLGACGNKEENMDSMKHENKEEKKETMDHGGMDHSGSGMLPEGLKKADKPKFEVGSPVVINADHMPGMNGAKAIVSGAYDTTVYTVSYTPTTGGEKVTDHKWVIHEELKDAGEEPLKPGTKVTLNAEHMEGMNGAEAVIDSAEQTTVYTVDYTGENGEKVTNHMWVTEDELSAK
ncbi:YdhK family protein [Fictibacillus iocasae]|uniref:YdhK family protein n=1 Tax=Fictibacillus iocasae TaxID=2715437 RepID=A0ABW2NUA3_9BACL